MTKAEQRLIDATRGREACRARYCETTAAIQKAQDAREDVYVRARDAADKAYNTIVDGELLHATGQENPADVMVARSEERDASVACRLSETEYEAALKGLLEESV